MKTSTRCTLAAALALGVSWSAAQTPVAPENAGLVPKTSTLFINLPSIINNDSTESLGVAVGQSGNVMIGWEDDGNGISDLEAVWTMIDSTGAPVTPATIQTSTSADCACGGETLTNRFVAFFRPDGSAISGRAAWGPKIKANLFDGGFGMGATAFEIGEEVPALAAVQNNGDDFPAVQLVSETGSPVGIAAGVDATYAARTGGIRVGDWDYLSNGNVLVVGESRQDADLVDIYGGDAPHHHAIYRVVSPAGAEVKAVSLASELPIDSQIWHGSGVTANGFAIRFGAPDGGTVRLFSNDGTPISTNINLATATGFPIAGNGGRGDGNGFHGNGQDAYVAVASGTDPTANPQVWVTVINTNGTIRYSKGVFTDVTLTAPDRVDAAIAPDGRVLVVADEPSFTGSRIVIGRFLKANGDPAGPTFFVSEIERPDAGQLGEARRPRVAWNKNEAAVVWESLNSPETNPATGAPSRVVAVRVFATPVLPVSPEAAGLTPKTPTTFINLPSIINNDNTESLGVAIGQSGNVMVGWEDDGDGISDLEAVWTLVSPAGAPVTPETIQTSTSADCACAGQTLTNRFVAFYRPDGSAISGRAAWGPKIKANLFGGGFGMGATAFEIGEEVAALAAVQNSGDDFPAVQLVSDVGAPVGIAAGVDATYASRTGGIRIGDWDYLSNGNVLVVGESRQDADLVDIYGGDTPHHHAIYRVVSPTGTEVKAVSLASEIPIDSQIWHGSGVTANGFAIRFGAPDGATVRLFSNDGTPTSTNINLATATGFPIAGAGGRGDGAGFHGNGKDAYVAVASGTAPDGKKQVWVTVLNTDGTIRYSKGAITDVTLTNPDRVDAAIDANGRVLVAFDDSGFTGARIVMGRILKANGDPEGPTFYVSEVENPSSSATNDADRPRVSWRNTEAAVVWESKNSPEVNPVSGSPTIVVALRIFDTSAPTGDQPTLGMAPSGSNVTISWPTSFSGFTLQSAPNLTAPIAWSTVNGVSNNSVTVSTTTGNQFFRLVK